MRVLITGCAGFIGSSLSDRLLKLGHRVVGVDNLSPFYDPALKRRNIRCALECGLEFHELDLSRDNLQRLGFGFDGVVHCAAQPGLGVDTPFDDHLIHNVVATRRLVEFAARVRRLRILINAGSSSIYGMRALGPETAPPRPASLYGVTKLAAEQLALAAHRASGLPVCSLRLFSVFGPRERPDKLIPKLIDAASSGRAFSLYAGAEKHTRSFTYISDVVDAMVAALKAPGRVNGQIVNIGSITQATTREVMDLVAASMQKPIKVEVIPGRLGDQLETRADISRARDLLDYHPSVSLEEGIRSTVEWAKQNHPASPEGPMRRSAQSFEGLRPLPL